MRDSFHWLIETRQIPSDNEDASQGGANKFELALFAQKNLIPVSIKSVMKSRYRKGFQNGTYIGRFDMVQKMSPWGLNKIHFCNFTNVVRFFREITMQPIF